jgi:hypothetical protein
MGFESPLTVSAMMMEMPGSTTARTSIQLPNKSN